MAKVVVDANVIISAAFGGMPLEATARALALHEVYVSRVIERELQGAVMELSRKLSIDKVASLRQKVRQLLALAKLVPVSARVKLSRDPKDDHYLSLCKEIGADFLITGDKDLLSILREDLGKNGISCLILTPRAFLEAVS